MSQTQITVISNPSPKLVDMFDLLRQRQAETIAQQNESNKPERSDIALRIASEEERENLRITAYKYILP